MAMVSNHYKQQVNLPMIIDLQEKEEEEEDDELLEEEEDIPLHEQQQQQQQDQLYEEEEDEDEDEYDDDDIYYLQDNTTHSSTPYVDYDQQQFIQPTTEEESNDDSFYLANRTFYTTCHKISRQNSPSYRKRPPYTFLENWLIHSVFSKSQQILLRFPVIHPKVMMTDGDFIYTPHQMANNQQSDMYYNTNEQQQEEEDYDYYDDAFIIGDEGVMVMSASAPDASQFMAADDDEEVLEQDHQASLVMDENMWMGHSRYNTNGLTLHVVNPDNEEEEEEEDDDPMYHNVLSSNNPYKSIVNHNNYNGQQLQMVQEEDEEEEEEEEQEDEVQDHNIHTTSLSMSPEVLNWYRSADTTRPILALNDESHSKSCEQQSCKNNVNCGCSSSSSSSSTTSTCSNCSNGSQCTNIRSTTDEVEKTITRHSSESYQSLADIIEEEQLRQDSPSYGTLPTHSNRSITTVNTAKISPLMQVSVCFVDAAWVAMDLAQTYAEKSNGNKGITGFVTTLFRIWKVLFLGAETMLGFGNHRLKPQAMV